MAERILGNYKLTDRLASDASGHLFAAWDTELERKVAVRVLPRLNRNAQDGAALFAAFQREMTSMAKLRHPSIRAAIASAAAIRAFPTPRCRADVST